MTKVIGSSELEKPYYIKNEGMFPNGCFMRLGTSTQPIPTSLIDELYAKRIHAALRYILSPRQNLTFAQLKIYYYERKFELNYQFANRLELLTSEGRYDYIAHLLADENGVSILTNTKRLEKNLVETIPMREVLINTIVHNDYSHEIPPVFEIIDNRMDFTSYGGLIQGQSQEDLSVAAVYPETEN